MFVFDLKLNVKRKVLMAGIGCKRAHAQIAVERLHLRHILSAQHEIEQINVLRNAAGIARLGNRHRADGDLRYSKQ